MITPEFLSGKWHLFRIIAKESIGCSIPAQYFHGTAIFKHGSVVSKDDIPCKIKEAKINRVEIDRIITDIQSESNSTQASGCDLELLRYEEHLTNKNLKINSLQSYLYIFKAQDLIIEFPFDHFYSKFNKSDLLNNSFNFTNPIAHFTALQTLNKKPIQSPVHFCNEDIYQYNLSTIPSLNQIKFFSMLLNEYEHSEEIMLLRYFSNILFNQFNEEDIKRTVIEKHCSIDKINEAKHIDKALFNKPYFIQEVQVKGPKKNYFILTFYLKS